MSRSILFLDQTGQLGGAELALADLAAHVGDRGKVVLFEDGAFRRHLEQRRLPVEVVAAGGAFRSVSRHGWLAHPRVLTDGARLIAAVAERARRFDVILCNTQKALMVGALAGALANKPVLFYLHDLLCDAHFSLLKRRLIVALANRFVRAVLANSRASLAQFTAAGGRVGHSKILYNPFDASSFDAAAPVLDLRDALGAGDAPLFGMFGRLSPWKGQHVVLEAIARVPGAHLVFVGDALFGEAAYARSLHQRTRALGLAQRVHFLGFRDDVTRLMKTVDGVIHASTSPEPFGRVIVEAMLCGTPVVAAAGGGVSEIIRHGDTGWLVPPGDPDALAAVLRQWSERRDHALATARAGRRDARRRFGSAQPFAELDAVIAGL